MASLLRHYQGLLTGTRITVVREGPLTSWRLFEYAYPNGETHFCINDDCPLVNERAAELLSEGVG